MGGEAAVHAVLDLRRYGVAHVLGVGVVGIPMEDVGRASGVGDGRAVWMRFGKLLALLVGLVFTIHC